MQNKTKEYYYIDIDLDSLKLSDWGISSTANHTGKTEDPNIHRIFLPKGQYNKLIKHLK